MRNSSLCIIGILVCLSSLFLPFFVQAAAPPGSVSITEVFWMGSDLSTADEWVEIASAQTISIAGWKLTTLGSSGEEIIVTFAQGTDIQANHPLLISNFSAANSRLAVEPDIVTTAVSLPNSKLMLRLYDEEGTLIDQVDDGVGVPFAGENASSTKASMERIDLHAPGTAIENWKTAAVSRGFDETSFVHLGTPGFLDVPIAAPPAEPTPPPALEPAPPPAPPFPVPEPEPAPPEPSPVPPPPTSDPVVVPPPLPEVPPVEPPSEVPPASEPPDPLPSPPPTASPPASPPPPSQDPAPIPPPPPVPPQPAPVPEPIDVVLSEVLPNPPGSDDQEWIEIFNRGSSAANIAGWSLRVQPGNHVFTLPVQRAGVGSGFLIGAGEYLSLRKSQTNLSLPNTRATVELLDHEQVVDQIVYDGLPESVSIGREDPHSSRLRTFCVPTEARANVDEPMDARIDLQQGELQGHGEVTANLQAILPHLDSRLFTCRWDFGDGASSDSCNPPSHRFDREGTFTVRVSVYPVCGSAMERSIRIDVLPLPINIRSSAASSARSTLSLSQAATRATSSTQSASSRPSSPTSSAAIKTVTPLGTAQIYLTEIHAMPQKGQEEWVELYNAGSQSVSLLGWMIDDVADGGSKPHALSDIRIDPGAHKVLSAADIKVSLNDDGDAVRLLLPDGTVVSSVQYPKLHRGDSYGQSVDHLWCLTQKVTPGAFSECQNSSVNIRSNVKEKTDIKIKNNDQTLSTEIIRIESIKIDHNKSITVASNRNPFPPSGGADFSEEDRHSETGSNLSAVTIDPLYENLRAQSITIGPVPIQSSQPSILLEGICAVTLLVPALRWLGI